MVAGLVAGPAAVVPSDSPAAELLQAVRIATRTAPDSLTVGDRLTLEVLVDVPAGCEVRFPDRVEHGSAVDWVDFEVQPPGDAGAGSRAQARDAGSKAHAPGADSKAQAPGADSKAQTPATTNTWIGRYTLAAFQVGDVVLSPWTVEVTCGTERAVATTDSIRLFVQSVLTDSLQQAGLQDLEPQVGLRVIPLWWWIAAGVLLVALVALVVWLVRRRRRPRARVVALERARPAHEVALEALRRLEVEHLPLDGKFEAYHVRLSEILRRYLEDGFGVAALEETTEEILFDLDRHGFDRATVKQVGVLCGESDLVKFAKHEPTIEECKRSMEEVRGFVVGTATRSALSQSAPVSSAGSGGGGA